MWIKSENDSLIKPLDIERARSAIIVRKRFRVVDATEERPSHYEWDEWQMTEEQYQVYLTFEKEVTEQSDALVELAELYAEQDDALVELAELIAGGV